MEKIIANTMIEIAGAPVEHVKKTMDKVIELVSQDKNLKLIKSETGEPKENEFDHPTKKGEKIKVWSTFTEFEIEFKNFDTLTNFCFEFMPSSIDIIEPVQLKIGAEEINLTLNDILGRLHHQSKIIMEYSALKKQIETARERASKKI
nr:hypothetical protein [Nanoarchaeum sp.]